MLSLFISVSATCFLSCAPTWVASLITKQFRGLFIPLALTSTSCVSISRELVRNANSPVHPRPRARDCRMGSTHLAFKNPPSEPHASKIKK